ncbi:MAG: hypothetical protein JWO56_974 [Acidobacteria bacterium]|nr:hypothetical protein [Acidobacteriota bacterium]
MILIDAMVVSELVNSWARFEFRQAKAGKFKEFRNGPAFPSIAAEIAAALRSILSLAKPVGTSFANLSLGGLLSTFERGGTDFNDLLIVETCRSRACVLITDDGDMRDADIPIVTGRASLLAPLPIP